MHPVCHGMHCMTTRVMVRSDGMSSTTNDRSYPSTARIGYSGVSSTNPTCGTDSSMRTQLEESIGSG